MNPRPPPREGIYEGSDNEFSFGEDSSVNYMMENCLRITQSLISKFARWLREEQRVKEYTVKTYVTVLRIITGYSICCKADITKVFRALGVNDKTYKAISRLLTFIEKKIDGYEDLAAKLRKALPKKPRSKEDTYVPPDSLILQIRDKVRELGPPYTLMYNVLVSTGCRGVEAKYIMANIRRLKVVDLGGYVRVHVDLQRGSKNEFVAYLPKEVYLQLLSFKGKVPHEDTFEKKFRKLGLSIKYFRKWWRQLCKRIGIDSEDIEAFQGRVSSIGGRRYTDWIPILDEDYRRILPTIKTFLIA